MLELDGIVERPLLLPMPGSPSWQPRAVSIRIRHVDFTDEIKRRLGLCVQPVDDRRAEAQSRWAVGQPRSFAGT
jgi:hypothetical protein